ncbi:MAG: Arm DNA-binding domain-containing protein, partial [Xanthobacteraceae bacterium]
MARVAPDKRKLTELLVQKIKPRDRAFCVWDTHQRGLLLRVQPSGNRSWFVVYSRYGRPRWYHVGGAAISLVDARRM